MQRRAGELWRGCGRGADHQRIYFHLWQLGFHLYGGGLCCFALSTIIGWGLYGTRCIEFLFGSKVNKPFMVVYSTVAILGATVDLGLLWGVADTFNGLMSIPNLIALFLLGGTMVMLTRQPDAI